MIRRRENGDLVLYCDNCGPEGTDPDIDELTGREPRHYTWPASEQSAGRDAIHDILHYSGGSWWQPVRNGEMLCATCNAMLSNVDAVDNITAAHRRRQTQNLK